MAVLFVLAVMWILSRISFWVRVVLQIVCPTNWLDDYLHTRRGMRWGAVICLPLAAACLVAAYLVDRSVGVGDYAVWKMLLWALLWFDAIKLVRMAVVSVVLLVRARFREAIAARRGRRALRPVQSGVVGAPGDR